MISRDGLGLDPISLPALRWKRLVAEGVELEVWILSSKETRWEEPGIRVIGMGGLTFFHRAWRVLRGKPFVQPDLITAQNPAELGWLAYRLAVRYHAKLELQDHSGAFDGSHAVDESWNGIRSTLANFLIKKADSIRTVNLQSFQWLSTHVKAHTYWLPIVPRQEFRDIKRQPISGRIVCVARLVPVKRHILLLQAFAKLRATQPDAKLILLGDGPMRTRLESLARELGILASVTFTGTVDPIPWLASADVFVLLSAHEGWGVVSVEAAMAGVPIVMSDTGCARWLEERVGALVIRSNELSAVTDGIAKQMGKHPKPLTDVLTSEEFARLQVEAWNKLCQ